MSKERSSQLKPLLLSTTLRNPQRIKDYLRVISTYENRILTDEIIHLIVKDLIREKLYRTNYISSKSNLKTIYLSDSQFTDLQLEEIILNSPQDHKEAGYNKGWPSRFDTWYMLAKELGFISYEMNKPIIISECGKILIRLSNSDNYFLEEKVFANAFAKYQRVNPYSKVLNNDKPLILLLSTLRYLSKNYDKEFKGISKQELAFVICFKDADYKRLGNLILDIRTKYGLTPSDDYIYELCLKELEVGLESANRFKKDNILGEMTDEFIRKMRLTGLITLRGFGRFIDINSLRNEDVNYILSNYSEIISYKNTDEYFKYMGVVDNRIMDERIIPTTLSYDFKAEKFMELVNLFSFEVLENELLILTNSRAVSKHNILKFIKETIRLEFLTSLILQKKYPNIVVIPNYVSDDEGIPLSHAPGNNADILCEAKTYTTLFEVTLLTGSKQHIIESYSVSRHLKEFSRVNSNAFSILMAPTIHEDTRSHAEFFKYKEKLDIIPISILDFITKINVANSLEDFKQ